MELVRNVTADQVTAAVDLITRAHLRALVQGVRLREAGLLN